MTLFHSAKRIKTSTKSLKSFILCSMIYIFSNHLYAYYVPSGHIVIISLNRFPLWNLLHCKSNNTTQSTEPYLCKNKSVFNEHFLKLFFGFLPLLENTGEKWQERRAGERGEDTQQRALGWNQTQSHGQSVRPQTKVSILERQALGPYSSYKIMEICRCMRMFSKTCL